MIFIQSFRTDKDWHIVFTATKIPPLPNVTLCQGGHYPNDLQSFTDWDSINHFIKILKERATESFGPEIKK